MVKHKQPTSLYQLSHKWLTHYLANHVVKAGYHNSTNNQTLSNVRVRLRPFFTEHVPVVLRTSLLEETGDFLFHRSISSLGDCDYGRSVLYLLYLLMTKEVKRLKVTLCCYYGCRDMEGVLRCIKKNGSSLERLELSRSSLLRMDPLLFRNVLTSATKLTSLVVKNICSDAMLKLIGHHCLCLQFLDIANSKQVSDMGIENLCCQVQIRDKRNLSDLALNNQEEVPFREFDHQQTADSNITIQEDFGDGNSNSLGCAASGLASWRSFKSKIRACLASSERNDLISDCLVEMKQVMHPVCSTLKVFDITDTSVTNAGLLIILKRLSNIKSLGDYSISENFLRSLTVANSLKLETFGLMSANTRKVTNAGMHNLVHVLPDLKALTCWEPLFTITDLLYLSKLNQLTLLRVPFTEIVLRQLMNFVEDPKLSGQMENICLEFILQDYFANFFHPRVANEILDFDISKIFNACHNLKVFAVDFKDSVVRTPNVGYPNFHPEVRLQGFANLIYVQLGQSVQNSAVSAILLNCPQLKYFHCNTCPDLKDDDLSQLTSKSVCANLRCFYIYECPGLSFNAFQTLLDSFPDLEMFGNLTRWAVNCDGIQHVLRTIRENNLEMEILCGSHWFASSCAQTLHVASNQSSF